jgi:hypothetical protein
MTDHILMFGENKKAHQQNLLSVLEIDSRNKDTVFWTHCYTAHVSWKRMHDCWTSSALGSWNGEIGSEANVSSKRLTSSNTWSSQNTYFNKAWQSEALVDSSPVWLVTIMAQVDPKQSSYLPNIIIKKRFRKLLKRKMLYNFESSLNRKEAMCQTLTWFYSKF